MTMRTEPDPDDVRGAIREFLRERLQSKLKGVDDAQQDRLVEAHEPRTWICDAARRVRHVRRVTHAAKFAHPDIPGSGVFIRGNPDAPETLVGTHVLADPTPDAVGANALDVYAFLNVEVGGTTLLALAQSESDALLDAFGGDEEAAEWMQAFAAIDQSDGPPSAHRLARQVFWPVSDGEYHLLVPLFPTSLVQHQYEALRDARFSDEARDAREARRKGAPHESGYREHPGLAITRFGGTQPQNISQLNSRRKGEAWLLASLPPVWTDSGLRPPLRTDSVFGRYLRRFAPVREALRDLAAHLRAPARNNRATRNARDALTRRVVDEALMLAARIQRLPSGWSGDPECRLPAAERFWLDPGRAKTDETFAAEREASGWREEVADGFSRWLNQYLNDDRTPMSDAGRDYWRTRMNNELRLLREELTDD